MVLIEGGEFVRAGNYHFRGQQKPVEGQGYTVAVSSFYMDKYEVTNEEYCEFLNDGNVGYWTPRYPGITRDKEGRFIPAHADLARMPVGYVNYYQAKGYAQWAGKRLPTEADWEYAAGGKQRQKYPWGNEEPGNTKANYGPSFGGLKPVGGFPGGRTPEGVFDLAGNIGEWCADYYDEAYYREAPPGGLIKDPQGPASGYLRVYRLGCQCSKATPVDLRATSRYACSPLRSAPCLGIRCVRNK
ncbi:MAG: SUMF1/EgtB/PvdO family nonheme iron enzyme [Nitrospiraceae bacterium]|nr:SUMF1/EgtB/PvdO family nonheme iron enzyme [Nitrospiraceae bacterium]